MACGLVKRFGQTVAWAVRPCQVWAAAVCCDRCAPQLRASQESFNYCTTEQWYNLV